MRKISAFIFISLFWGTAHAQQVPVVGIWEQFAIGDLEGQNVMRHDVVFVDRKLTDDTVFTALMNVGSVSAVLCCLRVSKNASITLADLQEKYPSDDDNIAHLKSITGWKYIYEAKLVDSTEQNYRMREIVKSLTQPASTSPYSAGIISGKIDSNLVPTKFSIDGVSVSYSMRPIRNYSTILYKFSVNGVGVKFTEDNFGD